MTTAPWAEASWPALGTTVHLLVTRPDLLDEARALVVAGLAELDAACSRFREDSEVVALRGRHGAVEVSPVLAAALAAALEVAELTGGLVDPTLGEALCAAGYDRSYETLGSGPADVRVPPPRSRWQDIEVSGTRVVLPPGVLLDLGASAKAFAADALAAAVAELGTGALVNLGGDLAVAGEVPPGGWPVGLADRPGATAFQTVAVAEGGLATSSTTARTWRGSHGVVHHILDPRTGRSASCRWASVSVTAPSCLRANAASTAAVVLGDAAPGWLAEQGLPAVLQDRDGELVRVGGWPA